METNEVTETQEGSATEQTDDAEIRDSAKVLESLRSANAEAKKFREERDALQERVASLEGDEGIARWKQKAVVAYAKDALRAEGVKDVSRVLKYIDLGGVDLDDEDNLVGFPEKLAALKKDLPELFDVKKRVGGAADAFADGTVKPKKSGTEAQVDLIFNGR